MDNSYNRKVILRKTKKNAKREGAHQAAPYVTANRGKEEWVEPNAGQTFFNR